MSHKTDTGHKSNEALGMPNWLAEDNWYGRSGLLGRQRRAGEAGYDHVYLPRDEIGGHFRETRKITCHKPPFHHEISAFDVPEVVHSSQKLSIDARLQRVRLRFTRKEADPPNAPLLRPGRERQTRRRATKSYNELAALHR
jgi:hypothetical protein